MNAFKRDKKEEEDGKTTSLNLTNLKKYALIIGFANVEGGNSKYG